MVPFREGEKNETECNSESGDEFCHSYSVDLRFSGGGDFHAAEHE
jgi:hypothetical protein